MTREELDKFVEEVENRPYLEYPEVTDDELESCLSEKELREIKGIGLVNKIKKYFRDKRQAKEIQKVDELLETMNNRNASDIIPKEYIEEILKDE